MFGIFLLLVAVIVVTSITAVISDDLATTFVVFVVACVIAICSARAVFTFTGFYPNYHNGERIGFVVSAGQGGFPFRTNEIDMQLGSGQQASLSPHFECSVPDQGLFDQINKNIGKECKVTYRQWVVMPWWKGQTNYEVTKVEFISK